VPTKSLDGTVRYPRAQAEEKETADLYSTSSDYVSTLEATLRNWLKSTATVVFEHGFGVMSPVLSNT